MSKILSPSELNEVKIFSEKLGFESKILKDYAMFKKEYDKHTIIKVLYAAINEKTYVEINCGCMALRTNEYDGFVKVLGEAYSIAKEMEK